MSTLMDYAYLRAVGDGYITRNHPIAHHGVLAMEREVAEATTNTFRRLSRFLRTMFGFLVEWIDKQGINRMRATRGCCGASNYVKGLV